ncbi:MAG: TIGR04219 family outer membrane beta-barrel protein [Oleiphilaceae bacterium]|nr:TIGR04219 family outer membrane beta-barrel protein [Oleiphilaceae bacterium]
MNKKLTSLTGVALLAAAGTANADVIPLVDVDVSVNSWKAAVSGDVRSGDDPQDLENDLGFDSYQQLGWQLRVAHPVPVLPNVRVRFTEFDETENGQASSSFRGVDFTNRDVRTTLDLSNFDYTLYYTAPLPVVGLDIGLNVKHFNGEVEIQDRNDESRRERVNLNEYLPMIHAHGRVDLPLTGLRAGAEVNHVSYDGDSLSDVELYLGYSYDLFYGQVGYRDFRVDVEASDDLEIDGEINGPFARIGVEF